MATSPFSHYTCSSTTPGMPRRSCSPMLHCAWRRDPSISKPKTLSLSLYLWCRDPPSKVARRSLSSQEIGGSHLPVFPRDWHSVSSAFNWHNRQVIVPETCLTDRTLSSHTFKDIQMVLMTLKVSNESLVYIAFKFQGIHFRCLPATPLATSLTIPLFYPTCYPTCYPTYYPTCCCYPTCYPTSPDS